MSDKKYIEANDLLKHLPNEPYKGAIRRVLQQAPTADVAPAVHGRWEHIAYDKYRCSVCKRETTVDTWFGEPLYKGCPYCFAIMDEKDGETDGKKL